MKIEIFIAIIVGVIVGIGGMFGIVSLTKTAPTATPANTITEATATPAASEQKNPSPKNNTSWDETALLVSGSAPQSPFVIVTSPKIDQIGAITTEAFEVKVNPLQGLGIYRVFSPSGVEIQSARVASLTGLPKGEPILYGSITDLTSDGLQMRSNDGTIEQVKFTQGAQFSSVLKDMKKIGQSDLAIGDRIVISGIRAEKGVVVSSFVVVIPTTDQDANISIVSGKIEKIEKTTLTLTRENADPATIIVTSNTKLYGLREDLTVRIRTKVIAKDTGRNAYAVNIASESATVTRSLFITE